MELTSAVLTSSHKTLTSFSAMSPRIVIIGGVAGGASAAARVRRLIGKGMVTLIEKGPHVSFASCGLPYRVGNVIDNDELVFFFFFFFFKFFFFFLKWHF
jgi:hypothetical protein